MINEKGLSMNKKISFTLALLCAMLTALVGCGQNDSRERKIQDFYEEFMEVEMSDPVRAIEEYVFYNDEAIKAIAIDSVEGNHTTHYEILRLEIISEQLWAVEVYFETQMSPEGFTAFNFVGEVDGEYKVMRSVRQIPQSLIENLDLDAYLPTGDFIDSEDVMIDTPIKREN